MIARLPGFAAGWQNILAWIPGGCAWCGFWRRCSRHLPAWCCIWRFGICCRQNRRPRPPSTRRRCSRGKSRFENLHKMSSKHNNKEGKSVYEYLVAPIVVGLVVLVGQFVLQPKIAQRQEALTERWKAKRNCYVKAKNLVNQKFASMKWEGKDAVNVEYAKSSPPIAEEVNKCYDELLLFSENKEIIRSYLACFGILPDMRPIQASYRIQLIGLMRNDLQFEGIDIQPDLVKFVVIP